MLWEADHAHWGKNDDRVLVWNASTIDMRPGASPEFLTFLEGELGGDRLAFETMYKITQPEL